MIKAAKMFNGTTSAATPADGVRELTETEERSVSGAKVRYITTPNGTHYVIRPDGSAVKLGNY